MYMNGLTTQRTLLPIFMLISLKMGVKASFFSLSGKSFFFCNISKNIANTYLRICINIHSIKMYLCTIFPVNFPKNKMFYTDMNNFLFFKPLNIKKISKLHWCSMCIYVYYQTSNCCILVT